ncbi:Uncharacterised protein [Mycobacteroides abscessus subsp. abscessus]|nr:Uncharacterised protein [Mycobacteroides abscessus subsp. abscessus]
MRGSCPGAMRAYEPDSRRRISVCRLSGSGTYCSVV